MASAPSRFPRGTAVSEILRLLQTEAPRELRLAVASALAEWGGSEALDVLRQLGLGEQRDPDPAVRAAALDAISIIGGPEAIRVLEQAKVSEEDVDLRRTADALIQSVFARQS